MRVPADAQPVRLAGTAQDITDRTRAEERIRYLARHDSLTGLGNRAFFHERLRAAVGQAKRHRRSVGVICLDLEGLLSGGDLEGLLGDLSGLADLDEIPDLVATVESVPDSDIGSLVSPETLACLVDELGQEKVDGLLDGTLEPDFSILGAVLSCGLDLSSIGN